MSVNCSQQVPNGWGAVLGARERWVEAGSAPWHIYNMKSVNIYVTQRDIDEGERMAAGRCAVAKALNRRTGKRCIVAKTVLWIGYKMYAVPARVTEFISRFDDGMTVRPFRVRVPLKRWNPDALYERS